MDGLISLLIIIGIAAFSSSRKKKQAKKKTAAENRAFKDARIEERTARRPLPRDLMGEITDVLGDELPLEEIMNGLRTRAEKKASLPKAPPLTRQPLPERVPVEISVSRTPHDDDPEGSVSTQGMHSTQGESREEHAEHVRRIAHEEQQRADAHEALREVRSMNLKKLRSAVVMSEILGKPVSLRPRSYR